MTKNNHFLDMKVNFLQKQNFIGSNTAITIRWYMLFFRVLKRSFLHVGKIVFLVTHSFFPVIFLLSKLRNISCFYQLFNQWGKIKREINNKVCSLNLWGHKRGCFHLTWKFKEMAKCQKDSLLLKSIWTENQWGCWSLRASIQPPINRKNKLADKAKLVERSYKLWDDIHTYYHVWK